VSAGSYKNSVPAVKFWNSTYMISNWNQIV